MIDYKKVRKSLVLQRDSSDCGVACLSTLINFYGCECEIEELRVLSGTSSMGTTLLGLHDASVAKGFAVECGEADLDYLCKIKEPHILHVLVNNLQHFVVVWEYKNGVFTIFDPDPARGLISMTKSDLLHIWESKVCMLLKPTNKIDSAQWSTKRKSAFLKDFFKSQVPLFFLCAFLGLLISSMGLMTAVFSQRLIDNWLFNRSIGAIFLSLLVLFCFLCARVAFVVFQNFVLALQTRRINVGLFDSFWSSLLCRPFAFFDSRKVGDIVSRINDAKKLQTGISDIFGGRYIVDITIVVVVLIALFYYLKEYSLTIIVALLCYVILAIRLTKVIPKKQRQVMVSAATAESSFISTVQGIRTIKSSNKLKEFHLVNLELYRECQDAEFALSKEGIKVSGIVGLVNVILMILAIASAVCSYFFDGSSLGTIMAVVTLTGSLANPIFELALLPICLSESKIAFDRIDDIAEVRKDANENICSKQVRPIINSISLNNVGFRYTGRSNILSAVNITLEKGKVYGIVGSNGSGKTTLAKILDGSYIPTAGDIVVDGKICSINDNILGGNVGVIPQEVYILNGTLIDNICLYAQSMKEIESTVEICRNYGLGDVFIKKFPQGYATMLGETGISLSGGEKQLIALARVSCTQPPLIVMDEPTSAMDAEMERLFVSVLKKIRNNSIIVIISHKTSLLAECADVVHVLKDGELKLI